MKLLKIQGIIFILIILANAGKSQMVTYSGPVEYHLEMIKTAGGGGTDGGYDWNVSVNERRIIDGSFFVTFTGGATAGFSVFKLTSIEENINYINTVNNEGNDQKTSQACYDDRLVFVETATPGDSRTQRTGVSTTRVNSEKPVIEGGQMMFRGNKYTFMLMGKMKVNINMETYTAETFPCWDTIIPPKTLASSTTVDFPIVISGEKTIDTQDVLEGVYIKENETSSDCNKCLGGLGRMVHGDVNCSYISTITTSWTLVKRTKECEAVISQVKGDVKINGVPVKNGSFKIGAGDVLETGPKSRLQLDSDNYSTQIRLGSKSKLVLSNPCTSSIKPMSTGQTLMKFIRGKFFARSLKHPQMLTREDFDSDEDWYFFLNCHGHFHTAVAGVRGQQWNKNQLFFASADPNFGSFLFQQDPEKEELIKGFENLPDDVSAFYIHFEDDEVLDITALKGNLKIEDSNQIKTKFINEGVTINKWDDGIIMSDVDISAK